MGTRHPFGIQPTDWSFTVAIDGLTPQLVSASILTLWNQQTLGSQITDLTNDSAGMEPISTLTASDGTDGYVPGQIEQFWGPEDVTEMWLSADGGARLLLTCTDLADQVAAAAADAATALATAESTATDLADLALNDLADVNVTGVTDAAVLTYSSGTSKWIPGTASGLADGSVTTAKIAANAVTAAKWNTSDFNTGVRASTLNQMTAPTGDLSINSHKLTSVADGSGANDAVNHGQLALKADLAGPAFTGSTTAVNLAVSGVLVVTPDSLTVSAGHVATDASTGNRFRVAASASFTLDNPSNPTDGQQITWRIAQDATGGRTITFGTAFAFGTTVTSPTLSTGANKVDFITAEYNSASSKWDVIGVALGY